MSTTDLTRQLDQALLLARTLEAQRDEAEADAAAKSQALDKAVYLIKRLVFELGYEHMLDADGVRALRAEIEAVGFSTHPGAALLSELEAARLAVAQRDAAEAERDMCRRWARVWKDRATRTRAHFMAIHRQEHVYIGQLTEERDAARAELRTRTQDFTRLIEEARALMRPQAAWEQEIAELRASASTAIERWRRSEAIRRSALSDLITLEELACDLVVSLRGDGNGRCWCGAKEADRLRGFLERADSQVRPRTPLRAELEVTRAVADAVAALIQGPGTVAAVRAAGDAYITWKARTDGT